MIKYSSIVVCLIVLLTGVAGQSSNQSKFPASPDRFMNLVLDETTVEAAIRELGQPDGQKVDKLDVSKIGKWLNPKHKEKAFKQLTYKKSPDFFTIELSFLDDTLILIDLEFRKNFAPEKLRNLFHVEFALLGGPASLPDKPGQYPVDFTAMHFPPAYSMIGISAKTFIFVNCASSLNGSTPGRVQRTRQVSRVLEKK